MLANSDDDDSKWEDGSGVKEAKKKKNDKKRAKAIETSFNCLQGHYTHLLALSSHLIRVNAVCNNLKVQAAALSVLDRSLRPRLWPSNIPTDDKNCAMVCSLLSLKIVVKWFSRYFTRASSNKPNEIGRAAFGRSATQRLLYVIKNRRGYAEELLQVFIALLRSLGLSVRYVRRFDVLSFDYKEAKKAAKKREREREEVGNNVTWIRKRERIEGRIVLSKSADLLSEIGIPTDCWAEVWVDERTFIDSDGCGKNSNSVEKSKERWCYVDPLRGDDTVDIPEAVEHLWSLSSHVRCKTRNSKGMNAVKKGKGSKLLSTLRDKKTKGKNKTQLPIGYAIGVERSGNLFDVTRRYSTRWSLSEKLRPPPPSNKSIAGKAQQIFINSTDSKWKSIEGLLKILNGKKNMNISDRITLEEIELSSREENEPMPTTLDGFKKSKKYVLERHLKHKETIRKVTGKASVIPEPVGYFRTERVFLRLYVHEVHSERNWFRKFCRKVRKCEVAQPVKYLKSEKKGRSATPPMFENYQEKEENNGALQKQEKNEVHDRGLYGEWQTDAWKPPSFSENGNRVPRNEHGNWELWSPGHLPNGCAYLPYRGVAKIAAELGIDHVEPVIGFERKNGHSYPEMKGAIVCVDFANMLKEAWFAKESARTEKLLDKRRDKIVKRWAKFVHGLKVKKRIAETYLEPAVELETNRVKEDIESEDDDTDDDEEGWE
eukprot:g2228.t1